jgi:ferritin-like metal-binding protein YciE
MPNTARDIFVVGLRNAHAMETQARELLERQSESKRRSPHILTRPMSS